MKQQPNELFWARFLAGELTWQERLQLWWQLRTSAELRQQHQAMVQQRLEFELAPEYQANIDQLVARHATKAGARFGWRHLAFVGTPALAAVALVLVLRLPPGDTLTTKGTDVFMLYSHHQGTTELLPEHCHPGDALRARYSTQHPYLLILGQDVSGQVQVLFPFAGSHSQKLLQGQGLTPDSWVLDQRPGEEIFVALFSQQPLAARDIVNQLDQLRQQSLVLPGVVVKEQRCQKVVP